MNDDGKKNEKDEADANGRDALLKSRGRSLEVTGLGIIASLIVAFGSLVGDGTILISQYLIFVSLLLVSASGLVWRIWKLTPGSQTASSTRLAPGAYRVLFGRRDR